MEYLFLHLTSQDLTDKDTKLSSGQNILPIGPAPNTLNMGSYTPIISIPGLPNNNDTEVTAMTASLDPDTLRYYEVLRKPDRP